MEFSKESIQKLNGLSMAVLNTPAKDLTKGQLELLLGMDIMSLPIELSVSTTDTRKTEVQYCTNTYNGSMKLDLSGMKKLITEEVLNIKDVNEALTRYLELKNTYLQFVKFKYASTEASLREMSREAQMKDKIVGVGRHGD